MRILVAEDEPIIRMDLCSLLEELGHQVIGECRNGRDAIKITQELRPDIVLMDIKMPDVDGLTATKVIRDKKLSAVVLLTSFSDQNTITKAIDSGALYYLVKPIVREKLKPALKIAYKRFTDMQRLNQEVRELSETLSERDVISRSKLVLQQKLGCSEEAAYKVLRKLSMERQQRMIVTAKQLLHKYNAYK
ncbi:ANTAR domain-containing response regulator [Desulfotomaculum sp. 1211_IL3151]|uniref:ANTAR domain-containing response regulator n=1 Tax=Desulfotomaculum sp. 1211_IL3151 TaxID=3084055 RepID=UPI002FD890D1